MKTQHKLVTWLGVGLLLFVAAFAAWQLRAESPGTPSSTFNETDETEQTRPEVHSGVEHTPEGQGSQLAGIDLEEGSRTRVDSSMHGSITGRVETPGGEALGNARVFALGVREVTTDELGRFRLDSLPFGTHQLSCSLTNFAALPAPPVHLQSATVDDIMLLMEPAVRLHGIVRNQDGQALEGVLVSTTLQSVERAPRFAVGGVTPKPIETLTDSRGRFEFPEQPVGRVELTARKTGYATFGGLYSTDGGEVEIALTSLTGVFGQVISAADGRPLALTRVSLLVRMRDGDGPWKIMDDPTGVSEVESAEGKFRLYPRTRRPMRVVAEGPEFVRAVSDEFRLRGKEDFGPIVLKAQGGSPIAGVVQDEFGKPVPGAQVEVEEARSPTGLVQTGTPFRSDPVIAGPDGRFSTSPFTLESAVLHARATGHQPARQELPNPSEKVVIVLPRAGTIVASAHATGSGALLDGWVRISSASADSFEIAPQPLVFGRCHFTELEPGPYTVELFHQQPVQAANLSPQASAQASVNPGAETQVALELPNSGSLHGTLTIDKQVAPFCQVILENDGLGLSGRCTTDARGAFAFRGVPPGTHRLAVRTSVDLEAHSSTRAEVRAGIDTKQDLDITTSELWGLVTDKETEQPLAGVRIRLERQDPDREQPVLVAETHTNVDGVWGHAELPLGPLLITPSSRFRAGPVRVPCEVIVSDTRAPAIEMVKSGQLELLLRSTKGHVADELEIVLRLAKGETVLRRVRRQGAGRADLGELTPGLYDIEVENLSTGKVSRVTASVQVGIEESVVVEL